jgi:DNA-binding Lrp family transcriptional regulator
LSRATLFSWNPSPRHGRNNNDYGYRSDQHGTGPCAGGGAALIDLPGVTEAYSVAGPYDLVAVVRVRQHDDLADLVAGGIQKVPGIAATNTLIAFRAYSQRSLEAMWDIGNEEVVRKQS